jgi:hypothetical protein
MPHELRNVLVERGRRLVVVVVVVLVVTAPLLSLLLLSPPHPTSCSTQLLLVITCCCSRWLWSWWLCVVARLLSLLQRTLVLGTRVGYYHTWVSSLLLGCWHCRLSTTEGCEYVGAYAIIASCYST